MQETGLQGIYMLWDFPHHSLIPHIHTLLVASIITLKSMSLVSEATCNEKQCQWIQNLHFDKDDFFLDDLNLVFVGGFEETCPSNWQRRELDLDFGHCW